MIRDLIGRLRTSGSRRWLEKGSWAVVDQGLYGAGNFILTVLLARWLSDSGYGAFAVALSALVLLMAFHGALITEPLLVFGPGRYRARFRDYMSVLFDAHARFSVLGSALFLVIGAVFFGSGSSAFGATFLGLGLASPFVLFSLLMRRACYVEAQSRLAASGGALYSITALAGVYGLHRVDALTTASALGVMAVAGLLAGLWLAFRLGLRWKPTELRDFRAEVFGQHWGYGRWAAAARLPMRASSAVVMIALPIWAGLAATGAFQAMLNLVMPVSQVNSALGVLLLPALSKYRGQARFFSLARTMLILFSVTALLYWLAIGFIGPVVVDLAYGGRYGEYAPLLWILGALPVFSGGIEVLGSALRAREKPDWVFWAYLAAAAVGLPVAIGLVALRGLNGGALGTVWISGLVLLALAVAYAKLPRTLPVAAAEGVA